MLRDANIFHLYVAIHADDDHDLQNEICDHNQKTKTYLSLIHILKFGLKT